MTSELPKELSVDDGCMYDTEKGTQLRQDIVCGGYSHSGLSTTRTPVTAAQSGHSPAHWFTAFL